VKEKAMADKPVTVEDVERVMEEELRRTVQFLTAVRSEGPEEIEAVLRKLAKMAREMGEEKARRKRKKKPPSPEALERARVRKEKQQAAEQAEKRRLEAEIRAARGLLNRIDQVEAIARRLEAVQGTTVNNARTVLDDANAILSRAGDMIERMDGKDKWLETQREVEVERRVRNRLGAEAREMRERKEAEIKAARIATGAALGRIGSG
jgi:hypothetical protein